MGEHSDIQWLRQRAEAAERAVLVPAPSLRDYFAGCALSVMLSHRCESRTELAERAFAIADAMIAARAAKPDQP